MEETEVAYWRGRKLTDLTKEELIVAMMQMAKYYEGRLESEQKTANFALEIASKRLT